VTFSVIAEIFSILAFIETAVYDARGLLNSSSQRHSVKLRRWTVAYVIAEPCIGVKDASCVDACPVDCIHPKKNTKYDDGRPGFDDVPQLYIDPVECIDCGACVPVCPVSAIFPLDDLPEKWKQYAELNASYVQGGKFTCEQYAKHSAK
jgi:NAD-dependent dihydropyrimidine dehydrogenase PreA subunit